MSVLQQSALLRVNKSFISVPENVDVMKRLTGYISSATIQLNFSFSDDEKVICHLPDGRVIQDNNIYYPNTSWIGLYIYIETESGKWNTLQVLHVNNIRFDLDLCMPRGDMQGAFFETLQESGLESSYTDNSDNIDLSNLTHLEVSTSIRGLYNYFTAQKLISLKKNGYSSLAKYDFTGAVNWQNVIRIDLLNTYCYMNLSEILSGYTIPSTSSLIFPRYCTGVLEFENRLFLCPSIGLQNTGWNPTKLEVDFTHFNSTSCPNLSSITAYSGSPTIKGNLNPIGLTLSALYFSEGLGIKTNLTGNLSDIAHPSINNIGLPDTRISGDLVSIESCETLAGYTWGIPLLQKTRIVSYTSITGEFAPLRLKWYSCNTLKHENESNGVGISEATLITLIANKLNYCIRTGQSDGYLHIGGTNPAITDTTALANINTLINTYNFTVIYNS